VIGKLKWLIAFVRNPKNWPFLVAFIVMCFNTEFAIPFILVGIFDLAGRSLSIAAGMWASTELCWWNWFSGWLYKEKIRKMESVAEAINIGQEAVKRFDLGEFLKSKPGDLFIVAKVKEFARKHGVDNFDLDNYQDNPVFIASRRLGYTLSLMLVAIFGFLPLFWIIALMICRMTKWKMAYMLLFACNFFKNYYLAYFYEQIGFWWFILCFVAFAVLVSYLTKRFVKKLKAYNQAAH